MIKQLIPDFYINKIYNNIKIKGFDILDENGNHQATSLFHQDSAFSIVVYATIDIIAGKYSGKNMFGQSKAVFMHENGSYFWSHKTVEYLGEKELKAFSREWKIGGVYKIQYTFSIPEFALPGEYNLKVIDEKSSGTQTGVIYALDEITILVKKLEIPIERIIEDYELSLEGCLLNPAVRGKEQISLYWTGNIEFFLGKDLRNFKKIVVTASGTPAFGIYPLMRVFIDERELGHVYVDREWNQYKFDLDIDIDKEENLIKIRFDNDGGGTGEDRNMYVKKVILVR